MPQSSTEVLKEVLKGGYFGFGTSIKVICLSPFAVCAGLASGSITVPTGFVILSNLRSLPIVLTGVGAGVPLLFRTGQYILSRPVATPNEVITAEDFEVLSSDEDDSHSDPDSGAIPIAATKITSRTMARSNS